MSLKLDCLRVLPLDERTVQNFYDRQELNIADTRKLCLSHERLRAELSGATILLEEQGKNESAMVSKLRRAVQIANDAMCQATFIIRGQKSDLNYAIDETRKALGQCH